MRLAYDRWQEMSMGVAKRSLVVGKSVAIGTGKVVPEVNYTLPPTLISPEKGDDVVRQYSEMVRGMLDRAVQLGVEALVLEFEHLPALTEEVGLGAAVTKRTSELMNEYFERHRLSTALRVTVSDIRDMVRPPRLRSGRHWNLMLASFQRNAEAGADMLSIESTGGKEVHDAALTEGNVEGILFALGVLACRDVRHLWGRICEVAAEAGSVPAGDTACGFANTAMVLADRGYIPQVLAAVVRAMSAVRSLAAYESGATGPSKDCAYEGPILKALLGIPISMEGKTAACAHFSSVGNIAAAVCDLWSNESVQNVQLLSGPAPTVFLEMLVYDCKLFNAAIADGGAQTLQRWLTASDLQGSEQAAIISPQGSFRIAQAIADAGDDDYARTHRAGLAACELLREAHEGGVLELCDRELAWLSRIEDSLEACDREEKAVAAGVETYGKLFLPSEYEL